MIKVSGVLNDSTGNEIRHGFISIYSIYNTEENLKGANSVVRTDHKGNYEFTLNNGVYAFYAQVSLVSDIRFLGYGKVTSDSVDCQLNDLLIETPIDEYLRAIKINPNSITVGNYNKVLELIGSQILLNGGVPYTTNNKPTWEDIVGEVPEWQIKWDKITDKPLEFPPLSHNHTISDITDIEDIINKLDLSQYQPLLQFTDRINNSTDIPYSRAVLNYLQGYTDDNDVYHKGELEKIYDILNNKELVIAHRDDNRTISSNAVLNTIESYMTELNAGDYRFGKVEVSSDTKPYYEFKTLREDVLLTVICEHSTVGYGAGTLQIDGETIYEIEVFQSIIGGCTGSITTVHSKIKNENPDWIDYVSYDIKDGAVRSSTTKIILRKGHSVRFSDYKSLTINWQNYNKFNYEHQRIDQDGYTSDEIDQMFNGKEI